MSQPIDRTYNIPQKPGERFCTSHQAFAPITGGMDKVFANGTRRRWVCARCVEAARKRASDRTVEEVE